MAIAPRREGSNKMSTPFDSAAVRVGRGGEKGFVRGMKAGSRWQGKRHSRQLKKNIFFWGGDWSRRQNRTLVISPKF